MKIHRERRGKKYLSQIIIPYITLGRRLRSTCRTLWRETQSEALRGPGNLRRKRQRAQLRAKVTIYLKCTWQYIDR